MRVTIPYLYPLKVLRRRARVPKQILVRDSFDIEIEEIDKADAPIVLTSQYRQYGQPRLIERRLYNGRPIGPAADNGGHPLLTRNIPGAIAEYDNRADVERSLLGLNGIILDAAHVEHHKLDGSKIEETHSDLPLDIEVVLANGQADALQRMREATRGLVSVAGKLYRSALMPASKVEAQPNWIRISTVDEYVPEAGTEDQSPGYIFNADQPERARAFILEASRIFKCSKDPRGWVLETDSYDAESFPAIDEAPRNACTATRLTLSAFSHHLNIVRSDAGPVIGELLKLRDQARSGDPQAPHAISGLFEQFLREDCYIPDGNTTIRSNIANSLKVAQLAIASSRSLQPVIPDQDEDASLANLAGP